MLYSLFIYINAVPLWKSQGKTRRLQGSVYTAVYEAETHLRFGAMDWLRPEGICICLLLILSEIKEC